MRNLLLLAALFWSFFCYAQNGSILIKQYTHGNSQRILFQKKDSMQSECEIRFEGLKNTAEIQSNLDLKTGLSRSIIPLTEGDLTQSLITDIHSQTAIVHFTISKKQSFTFTLNTHKLAYYIPQQMGVHKLSDNTYQISGIKELDVFLSPFASKPESLPNVSKSIKQFTQRYDSLINHYYLRLPKDCAGDLEAFNLARYYRFMPKITNGHWGGIMLVGSDSLAKIDFQADSLITANLVDYSKGMIDILPRLPQRWAATGRIVGTKGPGGFAVDLVWHKAKIKTLVVRSTQGGNCRLHVPHAIDACHCLGMEAAKGENPNPAFKFALIPDGQTPSTFDFLTYPGQVAVMTGK